MNENIKSKLSSYYTYNGRFSESWMGENNVLVSPQSCSIKNRTRNTKWRNKKMNSKHSSEYLICSSCKYAVERKQISLNGINNFLLGGLPRNLLTFH